MNIQEAINAVYDYQEASDALSLVLSYAEKYTAIEWFCSNYLSFDEVLIAGDDAGDTYNMDDVLAAYRNAMKEKDNADK